MHLCKKNKKDRVGLAILINKWGLNHKVENTLASWDTNILFVDWPFAASLTPCRTLSLHPLLTKNIFAKPVFNTSSCYKTI